MLLGMFLWLAFAVAREGKGEHPYTLPAPDNIPTPAVRQPRD
jgi:hypothetical protein